MISTYRSVETNISSPHGENHIPLFPLPQTDFTPLIDIPKADSLVEGCKLTVVDIAAPLGDQPPRLPSGSAQVRLVEQLEGRDALV